MDISPFNKSLQELKSLSPDKREEVLLSLIYRLIIEVKTLTTLTIGLGDALHTKSTFVNISTFQSTYAKLLEENTREIEDWIRLLTKTSPSSDKLRN